MISPKINIKQYIISLVIVLNIIMTSSLLYLQHKSMYGRSTTPQLNQNTRLMINNNFIRIQNIRKHSSGEHANISSITLEEPHKKVMSTDKKQEVPPREKTQPIHPEQPGKKTQVVPPGQPVRVEDLQIHILTASQYSSTLYLNGWMRHGTVTSFKCCMMTSLTDHVTEVGVVLHNEFLDWRVDLQNAEFRCGTGAINTTYQFVGFARNSCGKTPPSKVLKTVQPPRLTDSVGICLKVSYGRVNATRAVEWFELMKTMNVTRVFSYHSELEPDALAVFKYYQKTGFLDLFPISVPFSDSWNQTAELAKRNGHRFRHPRYSPQAFVDEVVTANDCKHRMAGLDFVIVMDIDEVIVPKRANYTHGINETKYNSDRENRSMTYIHVLKEASRRFPSAAAFIFNAYVNVLTWGPSRKSPFHFMSYTLRTPWTNYDGASRNTRWAFKPKLVHFVQNNKAWPLRPYTSVAVPEDLCSFHHYRACKPTWSNCTTETRRQRDDLIVHFERPLMDRITKLPLIDIFGRFYRYIKEEQLLDINY